MFQPMVMMMSKNFMRGESINHKLLKKYLKNATDVSSHFFFLGGGGVNML